MICLIIISKLRSNFARVLFSRNFAYAKFRKNKTLAKISKFKVPHIHYLTLHVHCVHSYLEILFPHELLKVLLNSIFTNDLKKKFQKMFKIADLVNLKLMDFYASELKSQLKLID